MLQHVVSIDIQRHVYEVVIDDVSYEIVVDVRNGQSVDVTTCPTPHAVAMPEIRASIAVVFGHLLPPTYWTCDRDYVLS